VNVIFNLKASSAHLFLLLGGVLLLLTHAVELLVGTGETHGGEGTEVLHLLSNGLRTDKSVSVTLERNDVLLGALSGGVEVSLGGVTLDRLGVLLGEEDELALEGLETINVELERLGAAVLAAVIDGDADGARDGAGDTSLLQLIEGEAAADAHLVVVARGRRVHDGAQETGGGTGEVLGGLLLAVKTAALVASRLVEPGLDQLLPVLLVVPVGQDVVVLDRHDAK